MFTTISTTPFPDHPPHGIRRIFWVNMDAGNTHDAVRLPIVDMHFMARTSKTFRNIRADQASSKAVYDGHAVSSR